VSGPDRVDRLLGDPSPTLGDAGGDGLDGRGIAIRAAGAVGAEASLEATAALGLLPPAEPAEAE
jgi:hypothetical protein